MTSVDGENDIERGVYQTPSNDDDFYDDYDDEDGIGRGPVIAIFFVILMAAFVGVVWLSYNMGKAAGVRTQPPVIHASNLPFKSEPDEAGGLEEPVESPSVAALSGNGLDEDVSIEPSAEEPIDRPRETAANETTPSVPTPSASITLSEPDTSASDTSSTATQPQVEVTPREVPAEEATQSAAVSPSRPATDTNGQLIVPRPSSRVRNAAAGEALSQEQAARIAAQNSARPATTTPATTTTQPATTTTTRPAQTATQGPPSPGTTAVQPSASQSAAAGNFVVQVASFPEIADADAAWQRLRSRHEAIVGNAVQDVQTAELGERGTWYRLRVGYYETRADANDVCTQLQANGQDCLVVSR